MMGLLIVALVAGIASLSAPHIQAMLSASSTADGRAGACAAPAAAGSARPAMSDVAAVAPIARAGRRRCGYQFTGHIGDDRPGRAGLHRSRRGCNGRTESDRDAGRISHEHPRGVGPARASHGGTMPAGDAGRTAAARELELRHHRARAPADRGWAGHPVSAHWPRRRDT